MNDELDTLRSFRPEAAGPTDALQLQERNAFMETLAHGSTRHAPRLRPRRRIFLVVAVALLAAVGTAGATGIIPDDVQQALGLVAAHSPDAALTPQVDQAVERTSAPTADGGTLELWTAPTTADGTCAYLRQLDAAGAPTDSGPISCVVNIAGGGRTGTISLSGSGQQGSQAGGSTLTIGGAPGDGHLSAQVQVDSSGAATLYGHATEVANIQVVDSGGAVLGQAAANDGWFLLTLPASAAAAATLLVAQSASGATVATVPIAPAARPG